MRYAHLISSVSVSQQNTNNYVIRTIYYCENVLSNMSLCEYCGIILFSCFFFLALPLVPSRLRQTNVLLLMRRSSSHSALYPWEWIALCGKRKRPSRKNAFRANISHHSFALPTRRSSLTLLISPRSFATNSNRCELFFCFGFEKRGKKLSRTSVLPSVALN